MPIEVIKYTCQFRCGKKAVGDKGTMAAHEAKCWKNEANKTCVTCSNRIYTKDHDGYTSWIASGCGIGAIGAALENCEEILTSGNVMHSRPIYNCPYWNEGEDGKEQEFADLLEAELKSENEGTEHYPFYNKPRTNNANPLN